MQELCELVGCGFSPHEAIVAATRNTAEALGVEERLGTIEPGKLADCIVIDGDPLADLSVLTSRESIVMVVKEGHIEVNRLAVPNA